MMFFFLFFFVDFSEKVKFGSSCEYVLSSAMSRVPFSLIIIINKKFRMWSATAVIGALTLSTLGKIFSRRHFEIFFLFFPENRI